MAAEVRLLALHRPRQTLSGGQRITVNQSDTYFQRRLYYAEDILIPEESVLVGAILLDSEGHPIDFFFRELGPDDASTEDRGVVNGILLEIQEAKRSGTLMEMYTKHLRNLSLNLTMTPERHIEAVSENEARRILQSLLAPASSRN